MAAREIPSVGYESKLLRRVHSWETLACPFKYKAVDAKGKALKPIPYKELDVDQPWESFDLAHELTTKGIQKFVADYLRTLNRSA